MTGTMEITTKIGCNLQCKYCPQALLLQRYVSQKERPIMMSLETFIQCVDKLPADIKIDFAGMCEPWLNPQCTDMVEYAHKKGHPLGIFTTLVGMTPSDVKRLCELDIDQLVLHLPDTDGNTKVQIDEAYLALVEQLTHGIKVKNRGVSCHGTLPDAIKTVLGNGWDVGSTLIDRAGNVKGDQVSHQYAEGAIFCDLSGYDLNHNILLPDGSVTLCCMDYGLEHIIGNLLQERYEDILTGNPLREIRTQLQSGGQDILCRKCSNARQYRELLNLYLTQKKESLTLWSELCSCSTSVAEKDSVLSELQGWCAQLEAGKAYLQTQIENKDGALVNLADEVKRQEGVIAQQKAWAKQLQEGKAYLEEQLKKHVAVIDEQKAWVAQLQEGKAYLEEQLKKHAAVIDEQKVWVAQLQVGKTYLEAELKNRETALFEVKALVEQREIQITQLENDKSKLMFYLREEFNKPWYKKLFAGKHDLIIPIE